jgi:hypothetical protein
MRMLLYSNPENHAGFWQEEEIFSLSSQKILTQTGIICIMTLTIHVCEGVSG